MDVTCYTDAAFDPRRGASWAVWLRSDDGRVVRAGRCPDFVGTSTAAELSAVHVGIRIALAVWPGRVKRLVVRSDSRSALAVAEGTSRPRDATLQRLQGRIRRLLAGHGVTLECRWVPGHQRPSRNAAAYLNHRCDTLARAHQLRHGGGTKGLRAT